MNLQIKIRSRDEVSRWIEVLQRKLAGRIRRSINFAGADMFSLATMLNFGFTGRYRPSEWQKLSQPYAEKYHKGIRTPTLILTGRLKNSIKVKNEAEGATVYTNVPYAADHQFGIERKNLPARPFFPVHPNGTLINSVRNAMLDVMDNELKRRLK
jgi:phage gpG-like protein